jgi:hypothetical protein
VNETDREDMREMSAQLNRALERMGYGPGRAAQAHWQAEDGWIIGYTTSRIVGGPHAGKFLVQAFRPYGKGARTNPSQWRVVYEREYATRKAAKARALVLYGQHSPKWAARRAR